MESLFSENTLEELKEIFGDKVTDRPHNELIILALALTEGEVSNVSLRNMVELHPSDLTKLLRKMCKENLLVNSGFGRGTIFKLNRDYIASSGDLASSDVASSNNLASSDVASSDEENVMTMITEYCAYQWLSSKDISLKIGRHPTHTRRVIKKMLANGILEPEYPNQPTHPAQKYRVKK